MAIIYVDSVSGSGTSPYDTWAKAATTFQVALTAWTVGDIIYWEKDSTESYSTNQTLTSTNSNYADRIPIYRVDNADDSYAPSTGSDTINYQTTGAGTDIVRNLDAVFYGVHIRCTDEFRASGLTSCDFIDCVMDFTNTGTGLFVGNGNGDAAEKIKNCTIKVSNGSKNSYGGFTRFEGNTYTGTVQTNGLFSGPGARTHCKHHIGEDFSGLGSGTTMVDASTWNDTTSEEYFLSCDMPASFVLTDGVFSNENQVVAIFASDSGGNAYISQMETFRGSITEDTATYLTSGWQPEGASNPVSRVMTAASNVDEISPIMAIDILFYHDGTIGSSVTFTVECVENFTTALNDQNCWSELFYRGTTSSTIWDIDSNKQILGSSTNLSAGTGLGNWTGEPISSRSVKLAHTVTPQVKGMYMIRIYLGAYESGKEFFYNPQATVT